MNLPCKIVQDLLPVYVENACSSESRAAVEEHLAGCSACRDILAGIYAAEALPEPPAPEPGEQVVVKSFRRLKRRWALSLAAMLLVTPVLLLCINQVRSRGLCFTNLDDALAARRYVQALEQGDFEAAADCMDYGNLYQEVQAVLAAPLQDPAAAYTSVQLDDRPWMAKQDLCRDYLQDDREALDLWTDLIFNGGCSIMVPENIWAQVTALQPNTAATGPDGIVTLNGTQDWAALETPWGVYYIPKGSQLADCVSADEFCALLDLVPQAIFDEALPALQVEAQARFRSNQNYYAAAAAMTQEQFIQHVRDAYIQDLKDCAAQGVSFEASGFETAYYIRESQCWQIVYGLDVTVDGQIEPGAVVLSAGKNGLSLSAMRMENDDVAEALFLGWSGAD